MAKTGRTDFTVVRLCVKGLVDIRNRGFELIVLLGVDKRNQVVFEFLTVPDDLQVEFFHFLSKLDVHLVDFGVKLLVLLFQVLLGSGYCTDQVAAVAAILGSEVVKGYDPGSQSSGKS